MSNEPLKDQPAPQTVMVPVTDLEESVPEGAVPLHQPGQAPNEPIEDTQPARPQQDEGGQGEEPPQVQVDVNVQQPTNLPPTEEGDEG
jgi:hypothetical protein